MRCKNIERFIIDWTDGDLSADDLAMVEQHVSRCVRCAATKQTLEHVRLGLSETGMPEPSSDLIEKTRMACHQQLRTQPSHIGRVSNESQSELIPKPVWAAVIGLIVFTWIGVVYLLKDFTWDQKLSFQSIIGLTLMMQNAIMLFFAPLLIRQCRTSRSSYKSDSRRFSSFHVFNIL